MTENALDESKLVNSFSCNKHRRHTSTANNTHELESKKRVKEYELLFLRTPYIESYTAIIPLLLTVIFYPSPFWQLSWLAVLQEANIIIPFPPLTPRCMSRAA